MKDPSIIKNVQITLELKRKNKQQLEFQIFARDSGFPRQ